MRIDGLERLSSDFHRDSQFHESPAREVAFSKAQIGFVDSAEQGHCLSETSLGLPQGGLEVIDPHCQQGVACAFAKEGARPFKGRLRLLEPFVDPPSVAQLSPCPSSQVNL